MAKVAFTVDNGIEPSKNTQGSVGSTTHKFLDLNFSLSTSKLSVNELMLLFS